MGEGGIRYRWGSGMYQGRIKDRGSGFYQGWDGVGNRSGVGMALGSGLGMRM